MSGPRVEHGRDILSQQDISRACGVDSHGNFIDYRATNDRDALAGLADKIADSDDDDDE